MLSFRVLLAVIFCQFFCTGIISAGGRDSNEFLQYNLLRSTRDTRGLDGVQTEQEPLDGYVNDESPAKPPEASSSKPNLSAFLPEDYNMHLIPKHKSGRPMEVMIQVNIRKILSFDEPGENVKTDMEFRVFWTDYKIRDHIQARKVAKGLNKTSYDEMTPAQRKNKTITLNDPVILESVWKPNLFFGNLLKVTQPYTMAKPVTLNLIPEIGAFEYLLRVSVTTDCPMDFHYYPADTQDCHFSIRAFSYTQNELKLKWYKTGVWLHELGTANFDLRVDELGKYSKIVDDEDPLSDYFEVYSFHIKSRRRLSYHVVQTFLPSTFYIIITCLCFLLPSRYVEARIGIAMTTLLTLTAMFASVRESTPQVSYVKAIDTWMAGCIMFVFLTLAEFTFITWLKSVKEDYETEKAKKTDGDINGDGGMEMDALVGGNKGNVDVKIKGSRMSLNKIKKYEDLMIFLEKYNFPIFIGILVVYSLIFWIWLLSSSDYFDWEVDETYNNVNGNPW